MSDEKLSHEQEVRWRLQVLAILKKRGGGPRLRRDVAKMIGVHERTIARWQRRVRAGKPVYEKRGRKADDVPRARRQQLIEAMIRLGPYAGVPTLRAVFTDVPYRRIGWMKRRLMRVVIRRWRWYRKKLIWLCSGATWAMDFTKPKARLGHGGDRLFLVRDLGSGAQLAAVACKGEKGRTARMVLLALFALFGAPLVLKQDNGSAFRAHETQALLTEHDVTPLASPPYTPQYNGACERSGGTYKRRVEHIAFMAGHTGVWLPQNLDEALLVANTTARPWGANGPTPAEAFAARRAVTQRERRAFNETMRREIERGLKTFKERNARMPTCLRRASIDRKAIQTALCEHGYLKFRRGRLSTPISAWKARSKA